MTNFVKLTPQVEATRSPVDGMWRLWALMAEDILLPEGTPGSGRWFLVGVGKKVRDALVEARKHSLLRHMMPIPRPE